MTFVLATANPGKVIEMKEILSGLDFDVVTRADMGIEIEVEETGQTFFDNAMLKARAISQATGLPAIADDSGLMVCALNDEPGVYSSTYGGAELTDTERCAYLLEHMKDQKQKSAKFVCTIVCFFPDDTYISCEGTCSGEIIAAPRGENGFGYDPVFLVSDTDKTMAELSSDEKNKISHRGEALRKFALLLQERGHR
ncbi:MAG: XTP/dITP diphosphatase [Oscillospiraceae bacterium]|nr:XTP/dITP diphosphatase [Oscillospiraceae bacterium]